MDLVKNLKSKLIVSCQALEGEPLHDPYIMSKMALAAAQGGAAGIRANTVRDIQAIKQEVDLPIIGIIKKDYPDNDVRITPTIKEVRELYEEGCDIIAFDATCRKRPDEQGFTEFFQKVKKEFPQQLFMADVSTPEEAMVAERAGVNIVATTLAGYTGYTEGVVPLHVLEKVMGLVSIPVIAEGNYDTPEKVKKALELGAHAVVVGSAITRPQLITKRFAAAIDQVNEYESSK
ncbi:N-acetylmannosamine-6-phosphate 2-epimerase [Thalassobacillus devorans]|uniref:N-acetylmannosamine-6-phosphate 2-epimerase n=1 Tax=Thalassobacillus devorans TaxID=279813 RepID=UPI000A1CCA78|nr:N-acetylmannosamine-6-phosphate 2-epimerase [Thalassobacillus devorans]